jgi:hypothetical protein
MNNNQHQSQSESWANWLLRDRFADDAQHEQAMRAKIAQFADRVLDAAQLATEMTIVDALWRFARSTASALRFACS